MMQLEGQRELFVNLEKNERATTRAAMEGLKNAGLNIIADAKDNLKGNHSVVTGKLRASGKVQRAEDDKQGLDVGFFSKDSQGGYAFFVEYGRRATKTRVAGNPTLFQAIKQWLKKKGATAKGSALRSAAVFEGKKVDAMLNALAAMIAKSIHKRGTQPHPFFKPAVDKNEQAVADAIAQEVNKEIQ